MRAGCGCFSVFGMIIFTGFAIVFLISPVIFEDSDIARQSINLQSAILCGGDTYDVQTYRASYHRPGEVGVRFSCVNAQGDATDVTGGFILLMCGAIVVPIFGIMLLTAILGISRVKTSIAGFPTKVQSSTIRVNGQPLTPEAAQKLRQFGLGSLVDQFNTESSSSSFGAEAGGFSASSPSSSGGGKSLTEQLKDLQQAYDKHLISTEEYNLLRQRIIDRMSSE